MNRRRGYAEVAGEAALKRQRAKQRKKDTIYALIAFGLLMGFFWWGYWMFCNGFTLWG